MHHHHDHSHAPKGKKEKRSFYWAILIAFCFMVVELIGAYIANSLALISDALHMFTDVGALALGLFVAHLVHLPATLRKSFGYQRAEALGALASGVTLLVLIAFLVYEAILRLIAPPPVEGFVVFVIASVGLIANIIMMKLLHPGSEGSLNLRAAYLHVLSDLLSSVGIIASGIILWLTNWNPIDPIITIIFALIILYSSGKMIWEAMYVLLQWAPKKIDPDKVLTSLESLPGVEEVHDLHIWSISTQNIALSAHVVAEDKNKILQLAHSMLREQYQIQHTTIQVEDKEHFKPECCYDCQYCRKKSSR